MGLTTQNIETKFLATVMFRLFQELWFASANCSYSIENMGIRLMEVAKSTSDTRDYVREYLKELIKQGYIEMTSTEPLLFIFTDKGKSVKTIEDVELIIKNAT